MSVLNIPSDEILKYAEILSIERNVQKELVFQALEKSFEDAVKFKFGKDYNISVSINRKDGTINVFKILEVVGDEEKIQNVYKQIKLSHAIKEKSNAVVGDKISAPIPTLELSSDIMSLVKSSFLKQLNQIARQNEYEEFSNMVGNIVSGVIKRILPSGIVALLGKTECFLPKRDIIFQEQNSYKINDRILLVIKNVERSERGFQVFGTRTSDVFLAQLLKQNISEIEEGIIEVKAVARDAGSRSKVAVFSLDRTKDPVGICIGGRGKKIIAIGKELKDEKVDIIEWNPEPEIFVQNCLKGIPFDSIQAVTENKIEVVLSNEFISAAIGRRGQNASLISKLTGIEVVFVTKDEKVSSKTAEFEIKTNSIMNIIGVDEIVAKILITEGFDTIEKIISSNDEKLSSIPSFNAEIASQLKSRAIEITQNLSEDDFAKNLIENGLTTEMIFQLFQNEINDDISLASLSIDDFIEIIGQWYVDSSLISRSQISAIIMQKRSSLGLI